MKNERLFVFLLSFSLLVALVIPLSAVFPSSEEAGIYDNIIRLHVLANSDSEKDQALKLKVRDGILAVVSKTVEGCGDIEKAKESIKAAIPEIRSAAQEVLKAERADLDVDVTLTKEYYPTREYRDITLPSGEYTSLRVLIGSAEGKNWWCVLFPQLCVTTADEVIKYGEDSFRIIDDTEPLIEAGLTPSQIELITKDSPRVTIKFRILEWLKSFRRK